MMLPWINETTALERLQLPRSFDIAQLNTKLERVVEDWLQDILTSDQYVALTTWLENNPAGILSETLPADPFNAGLYELVQKFLIDAAYAEYVFDGDLTPTESGLVGKTRDSSTEISDQRRAELYRKYRDMASRKAARIAEYLQPVNVCQPTSTGGGLRVSSARGRTESKFEWS